MATDLRGKDLLTCNICLEPFIGKHPKVLLCSHTFCLPCLTTLSDTGAKCAETSDKNVSFSYSSFFKCPTCQEIILVPKEGVSNFQPLFPCDLCDGRQEAELKCQECDKLLCVQCCNFHDKIAGVQAHNLQSLNMNSLTSVRNTGKSDVLQIAKQQLAILNKAVVNLSMAESELDHQRQTLAGKIVARCDLLINLIKQARDTSLTSLRSVTQTMLDDFRDESKTARNVQMMLSDLITAAQCGTIQNSSSFSDHGKSLPSASWTDLHRALLTEEDLQQFQHRAIQAQQDTFFLYQPLDLAVTEEAVLNYIGKVEAFHNVDEQNTTEPCCNGVEFRTHDSQSGIVSNCQVSDITGLVETSTQESEGNTSTMREERMSQHIILSEMQALQKNLTHLHDQTSVFKINADLMSLKEQFATIQAELTNLERLPDHVLSLRNEHSKLQNQVDTLKAEHTRLMQVQNQVTVIKAEQVEVEKLQEKFESIKAVNTDLCNQFAVLKKEQSDLMLEHQLTAIKAELKDLTGISKQVTTLKTDLDLKIEQIKAETLQLRAQIPTLTTQIQKVQTPAIAFHARLHKSIYSLAEGRILRLEDVVTNIGNGYNYMNGIFTAPVGGIYIFTVCASTNDVGNCPKDVNLDICVDGIAVATTLCSESETDGEVVTQCSCQAVVNLNVGQQVYLKLGCKSSFSADFTCFSGVLINLNN